MPQKTTTEGKMATINYEITIEGERNRAVLADLAEEQGLSVEAYIQKIVIAAIDALPDAAAEGES